MSTASTALHFRTQADYLRNVAEEQRALSKTEQFRQLLHSNQLEFLCEAHNGLSAKICEEQGFKGLWASGLCISSQFGVRDSNEASWTQVLEVLEFMSDATSIPILLDGDTGYGNFNNARRLVRKLEQRGIAAVCLEDKLFPKTNSFIDSTIQPLADMHEFAGKIKAAKDAQTDENFSVIARVEALIAGWGMSEALRRAEMYDAAGADGILIHSAKSTADEILEFKKEWANRSPVVIVPTKYYSVPTEIFRDFGFSIVIWANHILRSAVTAMQSTAKTLAAQQRLHDIEDSIASVSEVFRLQGADELKTAEERYLPARSSATRGVVLAASRGHALGELTQSIPKAMVKVGQKPLLEQIVDGYNSIGIKSLTVVRGYCKDTITLPNLHYADNDNYATTGELYSLNVALEQLPVESGDFVISYGDVIFKRYILQALVETSDEIVIAVDANWEESVNRHRAADYVKCSMPNSKQAFFAPVTLKMIAEREDMDCIHGEWIGMLKVAASAMPRFRDAVRSVLERPDGGELKKLPDLLNELVARGERVRVIYTTGHWLDVDSIEDVIAASSFE